MESFFQQPTLDIARQLLGMKLIHETERGRVTGRIIEVEAYKGPEDRAAHSYEGKRTKRTEVMYGPPGYAYIYLIYGMHLCFNIVTGPKNKPEAILVRALEPLLGIEQMTERRNIILPREKGAALPLSKFKTLTNGPGKLTQALAIPMALYGHDLTRKPLWIEPSSPPVPTDEIITGPRINIDYAGEARFYPWRFRLKDNPFVSK